MSKIVNSRKISDLHPYVMNLCKQHIANCAKFGVYITVTDVMRSDSYQEYLYEQGRSRDGQIVTWTKKTLGHGMYKYKDSYKSMAYDVAPLTDDKKNTDYGNRSKWIIIIREGKKLGLEHGTDVFGRKDDPHFQLVEGLKRADLDKGKRPSYWNDKPTPKPIPPKKSAIDILVDKNIISSPKYWGLNCVYGKFINGNFARQLILNFGHHVLKTTDYEKCLEYLYDNELINSIDFWRNKTDIDNKVEGQYMMILIERMAERL